MNSFYTTTQASTLLGCCAFTLRRYARDGLLTASQPHAHLSLWPTAEVDALVALGLVGRALSLHASLARQTAALALQLNTLLGEDVTIDGIANPPACVADLWAEIAVIIADFTDTVPPRADIQRLAALTAQVEAVLAAA